MNKQDIKGIERITIPRKKRAEWEARIIRSREDLRWDGSGIGFEYFQLKDGRILEIFLPEFPKESKLFLYKTDKDVLRARGVATEMARSQARFKGMTDLEIIGLTTGELEFLQERCKAILSTEIGRSVELFDLSRQSLQLLEPRFFKVLSADERVNNMATKALLVYLAQVLSKEVNGKLVVKLNNEKIIAMTVVNQNSSEFNADLGLPAIWTEGVSPLSPQSFSELLDLEVNKYRHSLNSK